MERTREHIIQSESDRFLSNFFDPWIVNPLHNDYGLDFNIEITENRKTIGRPFYVQNKGTDHLKSNETHVKFSIEVKYLLYYEKLVFPVLLFRYDTKREISYWLNLQTYIREELNLKNPDWRSQKTITLNIPKTQEVINLNLMKTEILNAYNQNINHYTQSLLWHQGIEFSLDDSKRMERIIRESEKKNNYRLLHLSKLNFKEDNQELMIKNIYKIINRDEKSIEMLIAVESLITLKIPTTSQIQDEILELSNRGLDIAKELKDEIRVLRFSFYPLWIDFIRLNLKLAPITVTFIKLSDLNQINKFSLEEKIKLDKEISKIEKKINEFLIRIYNENDLYYLLYFKLQLLFVGNIFIYSMQGVLGNNYFKPFLERQKPILKKFLTILDSIQDNDLRLYGLVQVGARYELFDENLAYEIYQQGLNLAEEKNHKFYQKRIKKIINTMEDFNKHKYTNENPKISQVIEFLKSNGLSNENIKQADPTFIFNYCKSIEVAYYPTAQSVAKFIYFDDKKKIYCNKKKICSMSDDLISLFENFKMKNCLKCQLHEKPKKLREISIKDLDFYSKKLQYL